MERRPSVQPNKSAVIIPDFERSASTATDGIAGGSLAGGSLAVPNKSAVIIPDFERSASTATDGITGGLAHYGERTTAASSQARALQTPRMSVAERTGRGQPVILLPVSHTRVEGTASTNAGAIATDTGSVGVGVGSVGAGAWVDVGASTIVGVGVGITDNGDAGSATDAHGHGPEGTVGVFAAVKRINEAIETAAKPAAHGEALVGASTNAAATETWH
jgi:hypothetical protein